MFKKIDSSNKIFESPEFQKDKYKFNLIFKNLPSPELELYSDEENYLICRGSKKFPAWLWTKDGFDKSKLDEIEDLITFYLTDNVRDNFTCKKELYDLLVQDNFKYLNKEAYFEMGFLICNETKKPRDCDGHLDKAYEEDRKILEEYWYNDKKEMNGTEPVTREEAAKDVDEFLKSDNFYVLRNPNGKVVCMVYYGVNGNQAKLSHVYTPVEERQKGYAANLIYLVTNIVLEKGLVPLLYTDYNYRASNKAYINAGYEDKGILINFSCSKNRLDNYTIRKITVDEFDKLHDLFPDGDELWNKYRDIRLKKFSAKAIDTYVIEMNGKFIGELTINYVSEDLPTETIPGRRVYLQAFRLAKEYQGRGIGQQLIKYVLDDLERQGYIEFTIGVEEDNELAKHIYFKYGFTEPIDHGFGDEFDPTDYTLYLRTKGK